MSQQVYERLERVTWQRRTYHPVGETPAEVATCMAWVRSLGHEARTQEPDGFRYRSVYSQSYDGRPTSDWRWAEVGEWLVLIEGENQEAELDIPYDGPIDDYYLSGGGWHLMAGGDA